MAALRERPRWFSSEPPGFSRGEVQNTGGVVATFRWLDDARAYARTLDGLVFDTHQGADVTYFPQGPAMAELGHDLRPEWAKPSV